MAVRSALSAQTAVTARSSERQDSTLSDSLRFLSVLLDEDRPGVIQCLWIKLHGTGLTALGAFLVAGLIANRVVRITDDSEELFICGLFFVCYIGIARASISFQANRRSICRYTRELREIALQMELDNSASTIHDFIRAATYVRRIVLVVYIGTGIIMFAYFMQSVFGQPVLKLIPPSVYAPIRIAALATQVIAAVTGCASFYGLHSYQLALCKCISAMFRSLAIRVQAAENCRELFAVIRMHQDLLRCSHNIQHIFRSDVFGELLVCLCATILGTISILSMRMDLHRSFLVPFMLAGIGYIAGASDELQVSSQDVCWAAYCGSWPKQGPFFRYRLRFLMMRAQIPEVISAKYFGSLNKANFRSIMRSWYSYMQALRNVGAQKQD